MAVVYKPSTKLVGANARSIDLEDLQITVHALGIALDDLGDMIDDDWRVED